MLDWAPAGGRALLGSSRASVSHLGRRVELVHRAVSGTYHRQDRQSEERAMVDRAPATKADLERIESKLDHILRAIRQVLEAHYRGKVI